MSGGSGRGSVGFARLRLTAAVVAFGVLAALVALTPLVAQAVVGDVTFISHGADGTAANEDSGPGLAVSASGRFVAFESKATNLADGAQPGVTNIFVRDRKTGTITLVTRADGADGAGADGDSAAPSISPAGRYVAFESDANNLSADDDDTFRNVFVRDTAANTTTLVSRAADGTAATGDSSHPSISANGAMVAFQSTADNVSADDNDNFSNVYVRDMEAGTTKLGSRLAIGSLSIPADGDSYEPTIDRDGRRISFTSDADNLSAKDNNAFTNVFVTDLQTFVSAVSLPTGGFLSQQPSDGDSFGGVISADGRYVAFVSYAANFVDEPIQTPQIADVFRRDVQGSKTDLVSRATGADGAPAFANSSHPSISGDGRFVAYESAAGNLSTEDSAGSDVFVRSMESSTTTLVSRTSGVSGAGADGSSYAPALSRDGKIVTFSSDAANLTDLDDDEAPVRDVFVRHLAVTPPPVDTGPDLGTNDHSAHEGHDPSSPEHAGHTAEEHANHVTATGGPAMTLFGPPLQDVDKLYMLIQPHADANVVVTASVKVRRKARSTKLLRFKSFSRSVPAHTVLRVKLKLAKSRLRGVKRMLKKGKHLKVKIVGRAQNTTGGAWTQIVRTVRLKD